jgi:hypothetical protein
MTWVRTHLRFGSGLALIALGIQIALSLVHAHFGTAGSTPTASVAFVQQEGTLAAPGDRSDSDGKSNQSSDVFCPVCALIQLAAISLPSAPPVLEITFESRVARIEAPRGSVFLSSLHHVFRARGPPLS